MIPKKTKSWIRRWMKRHGGTAWFKRDDGKDEMVMLTLEELECLLPKEASAWFDYEVSRQSLPSSTQKAE